MKHLKTKTELHQNVIDKCLKSLLQKQLIKAIKNVKVCSCSFAESDKVYIRLMLHVRSTLPERHTSFSTWSLPRL